MLLGRDDPRLRFQIMTTLTICQTLVAAMGPNIRTHTKTLSAGIIGCLGDSKVS